MDFVSSVMNLVNTTLDWMTLAFDAPFARAVVFGVPISGRLLILCPFIFLLVVPTEK